MTAAPAQPPRSLTELVDDPGERDTLAAEAVKETERAIKSRRGLKAMVAQVALETINRLRPGFLQRQINALLPGMALALDPWWAEGVEQGDAPAWLNSHPTEVALALLDVTDDHVAAANDAAAVAVYQRVRPQAPKRIAAEMPRIGRFIEKHVGQA